MSQKKRKKEKDMKTTLYNQTGKDIGTLDLPESIFGVKWNADLVHQAVTAERANLRVSIAHTKGRGEVAGGGKKPWKQKGTGRARHGSIRSPIWVGGGVTHGPSKEKNYSQKINRKMKAGALFAVLSEKFRNGEILFVDSLAPQGEQEAKTKITASILANLASIEGFAGIVSKKKNAALFAFAQKNRRVEKSFNNIANISVGELRNLTANSALQTKFLVIEQPKVSIDFLEGKMVFRKKISKKTEGEVKREVKKKEIKRKKVK